MLSVSTKGKDPTMAATEIVNGVEIDLAGLPTVGDLYVDPSFGFYKRPTKATLLSTPTSS